MRWWCSARGIAWTWTWRPYLGVWLFVALLGAAYLRLARQPPATPDPLGRWRARAAVLGLVLLWGLLDWPLGALGAGYLESVHMGQFLGLAFVVPGLLVWALPPDWEQRPGLLPRGPWAKVTQPLPAILDFTAIAFLTHLPVVVDALMVTQWGSIVLDLTWLAAGAAFWWPVLRRGPLGAAGRLGYTLAGTTAHMGVGMFMALAPFPLYRIYELAPPIAHIDPLDDQQRAGGMMMFGDVLIGLGAAAVLVWLWAREERSRLAAGEP